MCQEGDLVRRAVVHREVCSRVHRAPAVHHRGGVLRRQPRLPSRARAAGTASTPLLRPWSGDRSTVRQPTEGSPTARSRDKIPEARRAPPRRQQHHGLHPAEVGADLARSPTPQGRVEEVLLRSERTLPG